jgi:DNA adenine methylase
MEAKNLTTARPFLKWAGGKTQLLSELLKRVPSSYGTYHEPFLGGGALFFALRPQRAVLSDTNEELVATYLAIQRNVSGVVRELEALFANHSEEQFYNVRKEGISSDSLSRTAARMIYLNKTCFNGLYRVNARGEFNVPSGKHAAAPTCDVDNLRACSAALRAPMPGSRDHLGVRVVPADFREISSFVAAGDFVYLDPPYSPVSKTSCFTSFTKDKFGEAEQEAVADLVVDLRSRGASVLLSGPGTEEAVRRYERRGLLVERVSARRSINCRGGGRGAVGEILVTG